MYDSQLRQALLDWASALLWDAHDAKTAVRLFALVPFDVARTISMGLAQSGGRPLIVFEPQEYDFVFFSHWFGRGLPATPKPAREPLSGACRGD